MGQQNDKVLFQGHSQPTTRRKHIFPQQPPKPTEVCDIPGCSCPLPHPQVNTKVCSHCQDSPPPFLRTKNKPQYFEHSPPVKSALTRSAPSPSPAQPEYIPPAESIPGRIGYYNAWSLPTQKYHLRERTAYNPHRQSQESVLSFPQRSSDNVDKFIQKVTQQIVKEVQVPPRADFERRKQNMNMAD